MKEQPWIEGPFELLKHGLEHMNNDNDFDYRIAMISVDNSVELMIKTYLGLPKRISGFSDLSRSKFDELSKTFPGLLDGIETYAPDKLVGIDLGTIEWYHRIRNQLYHEGNGITIPKGHVEGYAAMAKILFSNLFDIKIEEKTEEPLFFSIVGDFFLTWSMFEKELLLLGQRKRIMVFHMGESMPIKKQILMLESQGVISKQLVTEIDNINRYRNNLVHNPTPPIMDEVEDYLKKLKKINKKIRELQSYTLNNKKILN